ncbi:MAG: O-antigen ligase family protein, partial [Anaerolineales bacterium]|nr:O-antigen ligase family protein [Anaerolineales bacterium]
MQPPAGPRFLPMLLGQLGLVFSLLTPFVPRNWPLQRVEFPGIYVELTSLNLRLADFGLLLLLMAFLWPAGPRYWPALRRSPIWPPLCALVILAALSLNWAREPILAWQYTIYLALLLASFYLIHWLAPAPRLVQGALLLALAGQSIVAGLQFWRQDDLGLYWLGEVDLNRYPGGGSILAVGEQFWLRAYGLTNHPNLLGGFLALAILLLLGGSLRPGRLAWPLRLGLLLGCAALVLSFSRAAWLGLLAGFLFLALLLGSRAAWRQQYGRSLLLGAAFCCVGGLLALIPTRELLFTRLQPTVNEFETRSLSERDALQAAAWVAYGAAPWTGVGA